MHLKTKPLLAAACAVIALTGCETTNMKMGSAGSGDTVATGGAGGATSSGENSQLEKCASPLGTVSLVENQNAGWYTILRDEYRLPPTANLLRLMVQQSNCFVVVERGAAGMRAMSRERETQIMRLVGASNLFIQALRKTAGIVVSETLRASLLKHKRFR